jgi:hypothetical protein
MVAVGAPLREGPTYPSQAFQTHHSYPCIRPQKQASFDFQ